MPKQLTQETFLERSKEAHGDLHDYSRAFYTGMRNKVEIGCKIHGYFWQYPESHMNKRGCPKCGAKKRIGTAGSKNREQREKTFIDSIQEKNWDNISTKKVKYKNNKTKVILKVNSLDEYFESKVNIGILENDEVLYLITLNEVKKGKWIISEKCPKVGLRIKKAFKKCINYFIKNHKPKNIIAEAEIAWGEDNTYKNTGFQLNGKTQPKIKQDSGYKFYSCGRNKYKLNIN